MGMGRETCPPQARWQALHLAALTGDLENVRALLPAAAEAAGGGGGDEVNVRNERGYTPLMCASIGGRCDVLAFLLARGADVHVANDRGVTPLLAAVPT